METESLILDWVEELAPLTPPQSDKGDQDNGTRYVFLVPAILGNVDWCDQHQELTNANPWIS
jgi:hypothetical protein